jgi:hypothetical protein
MNKDGCKVDTVVEPEIKFKIENAECAAYGQI